MGTHTSHPTFRLLASYVGQARPWIARIRSVDSIADGIADGIAGDRYGLNFDVSVSLESEAGSDRLKTKTGGGGDKTEEGTTHEDTDF